MDSKGALSQLYIVIESLRNFFDMLVSDLVPWLVRVVRFGERR